MKVSQDNIPAELRTHAHWVLWKEIQRDGRKAKVPCQPNGREAKTNDPTTWASFDTVLTAYQQGGYAGIGFVFSEDDPFCGIDLDGCRNPASGEIARWAEELIDKLGSYAEVSPSGSGVKVFVRGKSPFPGGKNQKLRQLSGQGSKAAGIEIYDHGRFFAVTGQVPYGADPRPVVEPNLTWIKDTFWPETARLLNTAPSTNPLAPSVPSAAQPAQDAAPKPLAPWERPALQSALAASPVSAGQMGGDLEHGKRRAAAYIANMPPSISGQGGHNALYAAATAVVHGFGLSIDDARDVLLQAFNDRCEPPWSDREIAHKLADAVSKPHDKPAGWLLQDEAFASPDPAKLSEVDVPALIAGCRAGQAGAGAASVQRPAANRIVYPAWTAAQLIDAKFEIKYLVDGILAAGQPCILAGPKKVLKTSTVLDLAISLATAGYFLGKFKVPEAVNVGVMSGESGMATIQETIRRICKTAGVDPHTLDRLIITDRIPRLNDPEHLRALDAFIVEHAIVVLFVDPTYLSMPGADAGNLFVQGERLRAISELCAARGVTLILVHHTRKQGKMKTPADYELPELDDISWAGFAEFARQWILLGRREPYQPGTGQHRLWLTVGGSAGHSGAWGLDVFEGNREDDGGRVWQTSVQSADGIQAAKLELRSQAKALAEHAAQDERMKRVWDWLCSQPDGATRSRIRDKTGINGERLAEVIETLLESGSIEPCEVVVSNGRKCDGYRAVREAEKGKARQRSLLG